jgi:hypothetical protein
MSRRQHRIHEIWLGATCCRPFRSVQAHDQGATASEVLNYLSREFGMAVRPNHLGMALQRHRLVKTIGIAPVAPFAAPATVSPPLVAITSTPLWTRSIARSDSRS